MPQRIYVLRLGHSCRDLGGMEGEIKEENLFIFSTKIPVFHRLGSFKARSNHDGYLV